jgi:3-methyladenine DNA glycosylase AlkD
MLRLATTLIAAPDPLARFLAYELVHAHPAARRALSPTAVRRLARGMASWADTDMFAYYIAGPAWRTRQIPDRLVLAWSQSPDRWWRRAALASTVPLNVRSQGGTGDVRRTLRVAARATADRDPMVAKALSWALRSLVAHDPIAVRAFLGAHPELPALVRREVHSKLLTGRKGPSRLSRRSSLTTA